MYGVKKNARPKFIGPRWPPAGDPIHRPWIRPTGNYNRRPAKDLLPRELRNMIMLARMFTDYHKKR